MMKLMQYIHCDMLCIPLCVFGACNRLSLTMAVETTIVGEQGMTCQKGHALNLKPQNVCFNLAFVSIRSTHFI